MWTESVCHVLILIGTAPASELRVEQTNIPCLCFSDRRLSFFIQCPRKIYSEIWNIFEIWDAVFQNTSIYTIEFKKRYIILRYKISLLLTRQKELGLIIVKSEAVANKLLSLRSVISLNSVFMKTKYRLLVH